MYHKNQLSVTIRSPLSFKFEEISNLTKVTQVFPPEQYPNMPDEFYTWYVVHMDEANSDTVLTALTNHPGIESVDKIPIKRIIA